MSEGIEIIAKDEKGNEFKKNVTFHNGKIDFGNWASYYAEGEFGLLRHDWTKKERGLCIDAGGLNHKGYAVWVSQKDMVMIAEKYKAMELRK